MCRAARLPPASPTWCGRRAAGNRFNVIAAGLFQRQRRQFAAAMPPSVITRSTARLSCCSIGRRSVRANRYRPGVGSLAGRGGVDRLFAPFHGNVHQHTSNEWFAEQPAGARRRSGSGRCERERVRALGEFVQNALRQLRAIIRSSAMPAPVRRNMRPPPGWRPVKSASRPLPAQRRCRGKGVELFAGNRLIRHREGRLSGWLTSGALV